MGSPRAGRCSTVVCKVCEAPQTLRRRERHPRAHSGLDTDRSFSEHWLTIAKISYTYRHSEAAIGPSQKAAGNGFGHNQHGMENAGSAPMLRLSCAPSSVRRPPLSHLETLWAAGILLCLSLLGCASSSDHRASLGVSDGGPNKPPPTAGACDTPNQGCECDTPGEVIDCGQVERVSGDYVSCSMGKRTCDDGKWAACVGDSIATLHIPAPGQRTQALGTGATCEAGP